MMLLQVEVDDDILLQNYIEQSSVGTILLNGEVEVDDDNFCGDEATVPMTGPPCHWRYLCRSDCPGS